MTAEGNIRTEAVVEGEPGEDDGGEALEDVEETDCKGADSCQWGQFTGIGIAGATHRQSSRSTIGYLSEGREEETPVSRKPQSFVRGPIMTVPSTIREEQTSRRYQKATAHRQHQLSHPKSLTLHSGRDLSTVSRTHRRSEGSRGPSTRSKRARAIRGCLRGNRRRC